MGKITREAQVNGGKAVREKYGTDYFRKLQKKSVDARRANKGRKSKSTNKNA